MKTQLISIKILIATLFTALLLGNTAFAQVLVYDSFESQDMSTTNSDGFSWGNNNKTSVVTQHATDGSVAVYNNGSIYNIAAPVMNDGTIRDWTAFDGDYSLRFRYPASQNWTEQRYELGNGYPEVWVSYWIRVPINYYRGSGTNNKWFNIQMGTMSQYGDPTVSRIEMQDWPNGNGGMNINIQFRNGSDELFASSPSYPDFITPNDAGRWMHLIYHMKASQTNTSTDGILRMYRKWEGDTSYTLINELVNLNVGIGAGSVSAGLLGWASGYIMGYANAPYDNDTEWLLDEFTISTTSLLTEPDLIFTNGFE